MMDKKQGILQRDSFYIILMTVIIIGLLGKILFTDQIIRASDVATQFYWGAKSEKELSLLKFFLGIPEIFKAGWDTLSDGGRTLEGGWNAIGLLFHRYFIQHFFPFPSSIAWLVVLAMCWSSIGTFLYCRLIGVGRIGAFTSGLLFVLCTENLSLINAGHIQKFETICWFPWVLLFMEKALRSGRFYHYALTALMLGIQFFHMHWQISFYSCLAVGIYWMWHVMVEFRAKGGGYSRQFFKDFLLAVVLMVLFFTTIAMSFAPLYSWSQQSERGEAVSGSTVTATKNNGEKGIGYESGMGWSMPPEEIFTFFIPGLFGYSRQEGGDVPAQGQVYYWGRMHFTQTNDYLGLLSWFLIPLPFLFKRDRYTGFFALLMAVTLIMALGKYTFVYPFMFEHLPAFSSFRVPKMILFLFAFGLAILAGRGIDVLTDDAVDKKRFLGWLWWCGGVVAFIGLIYILLNVAGGQIINAMREFISAPTRYQEGAQLAGERYNYMLKSGVISFGIAALYLTAIISWHKKLLSTKLFFPLLILLLLSDLWWVNSNFLVLSPPPSDKPEAVKNDIVTFLKPRIDNYRMQPLNGENAHYYAANGLANVSAYVTISERRYKQFLEGFSLMNSMPDIMNLKYLVIPAEEFEAQKSALSTKYMPVFTSTNGSIVLENKSVMPKSWLVSSVVVIPDPLQRISILSNNQGFKPDQIALVETVPPIQMESYSATAVSSTGKSNVTHYEQNQIVLETEVFKNSLLVIGEKYYRWWYATVDGKKTEIVPVNHILRGLYLTPGKHKVEFVFNPLPFEIGKYLTLASFILFVGLLFREWMISRVKKLNPKNS